MSGIFRASHDRNTYARVAGCVMVLSAFAAITNSPPAHASTTTTAYVLPSGIYPYPGFTIRATPVPRIKETRKPVMYSVRSGDTLTSIAAHTCHNPKDWTGIWRANPRITDPDLITPDEHLRISCTSPHVSWNPPVTVSPPGPVHGPAPVSAPVSGGYSIGSGIQACIIQRESGGNAQAVNPASGAGGLYQFLPSTWASLGYSGLPQDAPVWEQNQAFGREVAQSGYSAWTNYDGC